jgi:hypothetical protein
MKAKAEIAAMFTVTVITPPQRCLELARPCGVAINAKQTIAIAVKYPMRSAATVISASSERCRRNRRKAVPYVTETGGVMELFPANSGRPQWQNHYRGQGRFYMGPLLGTTPANQHHCTQAAEGAKLLWTTLIVL